MRCGVVQRGCSRQHRNTRVVVCRIRRVGREAGREARRQAGSVVIIPNLLRALDDSLRSVGVGYLSAGDLSIDQTSTIQAPAVRRHPQCLSVLSNRAGAAPGRAVPCRAVARRGLLVRCYFVAAMTRYVRYPAAAPPLLFVGLDVRRTMVLSDTSSCPVVGSCSSIRCFL